MKHFVGGWSVGTLALMFASSEAEVPAWQWFLCCSVIGAFFGLAAWGLLP